jgi:nitrogen fixation NifU-like protein
MLLEEVAEGDLKMEQVLEMDYNEMIDKLGRSVVASRPKCATLGLGTLKAAIRKYQRDRMLDEAGVERDEPPVEPGGFVFGESAAEAANATGPADAGAGGRD